VHKITGLWNRDWIGKAVIGFVGLLLACALVSVFAPKRPQAPAASAPAAQQVAQQPQQTVTAATNAPAPTDTPGPTHAPRPTTAPEPTAVPTEAPTTGPTNTPFVLKGAAPKGEDCPADHPIKGNIPDRGANKGDHIYHVPGDKGYAQTKPERCFVDVAEAEAAGYRPVKK
jgi:hypothetical protein